MNAEVEGCVRPRETVVNQVHFLALRAEINKIIIIIYIYKIYY